MCRNQNDGDPCMKRNSFFILSTALFLTACGDDSSSTSSSSSTTSSAVATDISSLPTASGEVSSTSSLTAAVTAGYAAQAAAEIFPLSSTGIVLKNTTTSNFSSGKSTGMCEVANSVKSVLGEATNPDQILCYVGAMKDSGIISSGIDDGNWHYIKLSNLSGGGTNTTPYIKMKIQKSGQVITSFTMYSCFNGTSAAPSQSEYIQQSFGSSASIVSKYTGSESGDSYGGSVSASGTLNSSGQWSSKTLTALSYYANSTSSYNTTATINQFADYLTISSSQKGTFASGSNTSTFSNIYYGAVQLINDSSMATLALGDGSVKYSINASGSGGTSWSHSASGSESWNGDTQTALGDATTGDYYSTVNSATLPSAPSSVQVISFSGDEVWDCSLPAGSTWSDADFNAGGSSLSTAMTACENKIGLGRGWIDCSATYQ